MIYKTEKQTSERAYNLLEKARDMQGLPMKSSETLLYEKFGINVYKEDNELFFSDAPMRMSDDSDSLENKYVVGRDLTHATEDEFRIRNNFEKNEGTSWSFSYGKSADPVVKKLDEETPKELGHDAFNVKRFYLTKFDARTLGEEDYNRIKETPLKQFYEEEIKKFSEMESRPLEMTLQPWERNIEIDPVTLGLANIKTKNNLEKWIIKNDKYVSENKDILKQELDGIKSLQKLNFNATEAQKYVYPYDIFTIEKYSKINEKKMEWCNHEGSYVHAREFMERGLAEKLTEEEERIRNCSTETFPDNFTNTLARLSMWSMYNSKDRKSKTIGIFVDRCRDLIDARKMKELDYNAAVNVVNAKSDEDMVGLMRNMNKKFRAKKLREEKGAAKMTNQEELPTYISPLTARALKEKMRNFVENGGYFIDRGNRTFSNYLDE